MRQRWMQGEVRKMGGGTEVGIEGRGMGQRK